MKNIMVRGLDDAVVAALRLDAASCGRSLEAQIRTLLERVALPAGRLRLGTALWLVGQEVGGVDLDMLRDGRQRGL